MCLVVVLYFFAKADSELCHIRPHTSGLKLVVGLRFIFFGRDDEDDLLHLVKKVASLLRKEAMST
jgi:hypothetical protein